MLCKLETFNGDYFIMNDFIMDNPTHEMGIHEKTKIRYKNITS